MIDDGWSVNVEVKEAKDKKLRTGILVKVNPNSRIVDHRSRIGRLVEKVEGKEEKQYLYTVHSNIHMLPIHIHKDFIIQDKNTLFTLFLNPTKPHFSCKPV